MTGLLIASLVVRVTAILAGAVVMSALFRRSSAAARHLLWTVAIGASLATPLLSVMLPHVSVRVLPAAMEQPITEALGAGSMASTPPAVPRTRSDQVIPARAAARSIAGAAVRSDDAAVAPRGESSVPFLAMLAYVAGTLFVLLRLGCGTVRMAWIARRARPVRTGAWGTLAEQLAASLGIHGRIIFLEGEGDAMPVAWGVLRHRVLLPRAAADWPVERQRIVLLHELAHVKRRDCLTQLAAQVACAVYWFNPLMWLASRRLRAEREHACDDLVLACGTRGSEYADHLLDIARSLRGSSPATWAAVAMAHRSQLEGRLMAILEPGVVRHKLTRGAAAGLGIAFTAGAIAAAIVTPVATTTLTAASFAGMASVAPIGGTRQPLPTPTPTPSPSPLAAPSLTTEIVRGVAEGIPDAIADVVSETLGGLDQDSAPKGVTGGVRGGVRGGVPGGIASGVRGGIVDGVRSGVRREERSANPRVVAALVEALRDTDAEVRKQALLTLAQMGSKEAEDPIRAAAKDPDPEVRRQAVFALGQFDDPANYELLASALGDSDVSVSEQAAFALGQLGDHRAVGPLAGTLKSSRSPEVRKQCAFALGLIGDAGAVDALIAALRDDNVDVRAQAAFALGEIGDARASDALMTALKDPNPQVRRQAAFALSQIEK